MKKDQGILIIREYEPSDFQGLLEISKHIWEGHDYLPKKIEDFYNDPLSIPLVLIDEGKLVSIANLRFLNADIAWLEGIRTHPNARRKGYATLLTEEMMKIAMKKGVKEIWLMTNAENKSTAILLRNLQFSEKGKLVMWPDWETMVESLKMKDIQNKHIDTLSLKKIGKYQPEQKNPYRALIESIPVSKEALILRKKWKQITKKSQIDTVLSKIGQKEGMNVLLGEFHVYPQTAYILDQMIKKKQLYFLDNPPALLLLEKSSEIDSGYGVGLNTYSLVALESAVHFLLSNFPDMTYWLFFPESLQHPHIQPGFHLQKLMVKNLNPSTI